ncbi:MAG TPA: hypothetical protein VMM15_20775 [Bradyrhizobium sp.]|nr:hypothetical protein [Bradyrhizobium sp.]
MQGTLVLAILTVRSSYARQIEERLVDHADVPDTLQWWIAAGGSWRIRTYAIDHDIHTHQVDGDPTRLLTLASEGNRKHYGDVLAAEHVLHFADSHDWSDVDAKFRAIGLAPRLEIAADRFAFWKPDDARYATKSRPVE